MSERPIPPTALERNLIERVRVGDVVSRTADLHPQRAAIRTVTSSAHAQSFAGRAAAALRRAATCVAFAIASVPVAPRAEPAVSAQFAEQCALRLPAASVRVAALRKAHVIRTDLPVERLNAMRNEGHRDNGKATLGVTVARLQTSVTVSSRMLKERTTGQACMRAGIEATLTYSPMDIYVAREFGDDPCAYDHILQHELRHVAAHEAQLDHASRKLEQAMREYFDDRILYGSEATLRAHLEDELRTRWLPMGVGYLQEVRSLHERIDTPEEYARNRTVCGGRIARALDGRTRP